MVSGFRQLGVGRGVTNGREGGKAPSGKSAPGGRGAAGIGELRRERCERCGARGAAGIGELSYGCVMGLTEERAI